MQALVGKQPPGVSQKMAGGFAFGWRCKMLPGAAFEAQAKRVVMIFLGDLGVGVEGDLP